MYEYEGGCWDFRTLSVHSETIVVMLFVETTSGFDLLVSVDAAVYHSRDVSIEMHHIVPESSLILFFSGVQLFVS